MIFFNSEISKIERLEQDCDKYIREANEAKKELKEIQKRYDLLALAYRRATGVSSLTFFTRT